MLIGVYEPVANAFKLAWSALLGAPWPPPPRPPPPYHAHRHRPRPRGLLVLQHPSTLLAQLCPRGLASPPPPPTVHADEPLDLACFRVSVLLHCVNTARALPAFLGTWVHQRFLHRGCWQSSSSTLLAPTPTARTRCLAE